jgi:CarboxypepD_reg-like domain
MKVRKFLLFFFGLLMIMVNQAGAQTTITGTVKDSKGMPVIGASVFPKDSKNGISTDTLGFFSVKTNPGGSLTITAVGFLDTTISINYQRSISVVLLQKADLLKKVVIAHTEDHNTVSSNNITNEQLIANTLEDYASSEQLSGGVKSYSYNTVSSTPTGERVTGIGHVITTENMGSVNYGGMVPVFHQPTETKGTRLLLSNWSQGIVVDQNDTVIRNTSFLFNFDKVTGDLMMTQDQQNYIDIDREKVKSFALKSNDIGVVFTRVPSISKEYLELLGQGPKYAAFKSIKTKLIKANGESNGLTAVGNDFDEYVDTYVYYIIDLKTNAAKQIELKKKSIKDAVDADKDKAEKYFADHKRDDINDIFLKGFINYLNS